MAIADQTVKQGLKTINHHFIINWQLMIHILALTALFLKWTKYSIPFYIALTIERERASSNTVNCIDMLCINWRISILSIPVIQLWWVCDVFYKTMLNIRNFLQLSTVSKKLSHQSKLWTRNMKSEYQYKPTTLIMCNYCPEIRDKWINITTKPTKHNRKLRVRYKNDLEYKIKRNGIITINHRLVTQTTVHVVIASWSC